MDNIDTPMAPEPPTATMECSRCGTTFKGNPRSQPLGSKNYCSIGCEEGKGPLPDDSPQSPNHWLHVQGDPETVIGQWLLATGLKRVDYSPEWCRDPSSVSSAELVYVNEHEEVFVRRTSVCIGKIVSYQDGTYVVERENLETGEVHTREISDSVLLAQLRRDQWWVEG